MELYAIILLFVLITVASGGAGFFYKKITSLHEKGQDIPIVLCIAPLPLCILFAVLASISGWQWNLCNVLCGVCGGISFLLAVAMLLLAVGKGDYSVSVIIINLSFFIPILLSAIFLDEKISLLQILGIAVLFFVIVFSNIQLGGKGKKQGKGGADLSQEQGGGKDPSGKESLPKQGEKNTAKAPLFKKNANVWIFYAILACVFNGLVNFCLKVQQYYSPSQGQDTFYFIMHLVSFLIGTILVVSVKGARVQRRHPAYIPLAAAGLGLCVAFNYYPMSYLTEQVSAALLFGVATAGAILMSLVSGWIFFREKVTVRSIVSIVCCILAIALQIAAL